MPSISREWGVVAERAERAAVPSHPAVLGMEALIANTRFCQALLDCPTNRAHIIETVADSFPFHRTRQQRHREQNDEWLVGRHYVSETSMQRVLHSPPETPAPLPLEAAAS